MSSGEHCGEITQCGEGSCRPFSALLCGGGREEVAHASQASRVNQALSCQLAESDGSFPELQSKIVKVTAEMNEWRVMATEATADLNGPQADVTLQSPFQE